MLLLGRILKFAPVSQLCCWNNRWSGRSELYPGYDQGRHTLGLRERTLGTPLSCTESTITILHRLNQSSYRINIRQSMPPNLSCWTQESTIFPSNGTPSMSTRRFPVDVDIILHTSALTFQWKNGWIKIKSHILGAPCWSTSDSRCTRGVHHHGWQVQLQPRDRPLKCHSPPGVFERQWRKPGRTSALWCWLDWQTRTPTTLPPGRSIRPRGLSVLLSIYCFPSNAYTIKKRKYVCSFFLKPNQVIRI